MCEDARGQVRVGQREGAQAGERGEAGPREVRGGCHIRPRCDAAQRQLLEQREAGHSGICYLENTATAVAIGSRRRGNDGQREYTQRAREAAKETDRQRSARESEHELAQPAELAPDCGRRRKRQRRCTLRVGARYRGSLAIRDAFAIFNAQGGQAGHAAHNYEWAATFE